MSVDPRLLIPLAELPGLDPVGLDVYFDGRNELCNGLDAGRAVVWDDAGRGFDAVVASVSLADASTRDRCLRLEGRKRGVHGCGAPSFGAVYQWDEAAFAAGSTPGLRFVGYALGEQTGPDWPTYPAEMFDGIDMSDPTLLEDSSLRRDALALAAVLRGAP